MSTESTTNADLALEDFFTVHTSSDVFWRGLEYFNTLRPDEAEELGQPVFVIAG
jgi:hypothetical protein